MVSDKLHCYINRRELFRLKLAKIVHYGELIEIHLEKQSKR